MRTLPLLGFVAWALSLAACTVTATVEKTPDEVPGGSGSTSGKDTPVAPPTVEDQTCASDADCVVVETACCDHCNGGNVEAVITSRADAYKAKGCEETMCTQRGCGAAVAKCTSGRCAVEIQPIM